MRRISLEYIYPKGKYHGMSYAQEIRIIGRQNALNNSRWPLVIGQYLIGTVPICAIDKTVCTDLAGGNFRDA